MSNGDMCCQTLIGMWDLNANIIGVNLQLTDIILRCLNYDTTEESNRQVFINSDRIKTCTTTEVNDKCSELVGAAPQAMYTLLELAKALGNDNTYATHIQNQIIQKHLLECRTQ
jgi:hypothetical protein